MSVISILIGWLTHILHVRARRREENNGENESIGEEVGSVTSSASRDQEVISSPKKNAEQ